MTQERIDEIEKWHHETMVVGRLLAGSDPLKCTHCGKVAKCFARYEEHGPAALACDECCGHGNEDGWCVPLDRAQALLEAEVRLSCDAKAGAEAEELRSAIEHEMQQCDDDDSVSVEDLQRMLDSIDARDSITACDRWIANGKTRADEKMKAKIERALKELENVDDHQDPGVIFGIAEDVKKILSE